MNTLLSSNALSQISKVEVLDNYTTEDFSNSTQMWAGLSIDDGSLLFGNSTALVRYDGNKWSSIHVGRREVVFSLDKNNAGKVYVGGLNDFGFLEPDSLNQMKYFSLFDLIPEDARDFSQVRQTIAHQNKVYFRSLEYLFIYSEIEDSISVLDYKDILDNAFLVNDEILLNVHGLGVSIVADEGFVLLEGTEILKNDRIYGIVENGNELIIYSREKGLLRYNNKKLQPIESELNALLSEYPGYRLIKLDNNSYGFGTLGGGIIIFDKNFNLIEHITTDKGLNDNDIYGLFLDRNNLLWATLSNGISVINTDQHFRSINLPDEAGTPFKTVELNEKLFAITNQKVLEYNIDSESFDDVLKYDSNFIYDVASSDNQLIISSTNGVWQIEPILRQINERTYTDLLFHDERLYGFNDYGLFEIDLNIGEEELVVAEYVFSDNTTSFKNSIAFTTSADELVLFDPDNKNSQKIANPEKKITGIRSLVVEEDSLFVLSSSNGLWVLDERNLVLRKRVRKHNINLSANDVSYFNQCDNEFWYSSSLNLLRSIQSDLDFKVEEKWFQGIGFENGIYGLDCGENHVWFAEERKIVGVPVGYSHQPTNFKTNITGTFVDQDSLIYGGFGEPSNEIILPYKDNALRFTYAAACYIDPERNTYSYKLEGFDAKWSDWSLETQKDYTNIPEGDYVFKVKSQNVFGVEGSTDSLAFSILPPWYRTWWAYLLYVIGISGLIYTAHRIRLNQLLKVERMRTKIASDLHDEVSATLTGISYFAEAVKTDQDEQRKSHFINLITESAGDAKEKITDIVWSITPENDNWELFLSKCRRYASDLLESSDIKYNLNITQAIDGELSMNVRQHLWMIFKEMLTNTVRHSKATQVDVILDVEDGLLKLIVQDNGAGFDVDSGRIGNGVANIKKRAEELGASISLISEPEMGTRWRLELPL
ncbi:MAG: hypothetical protein JJ895_07315 [Balneolaceae bacterium]|nr:hypothetical protein [Balneolaceae bacterium]